MRQKDRRSLRHGQSVEAGWWWRRRIDVAMKPLGASSSSIGGVATACGLRRGGGFDGGTDSTDEQDLKMASTHSELVLPAAESTTAATAFAKGAIVMSGLATNAASRLNTMRAVDRDPLSKARGRRPRRGDSPKESPWGNGLKTGHSCKDTDLRLVTLPSSSLELFLVFESSNSIFIAADNLEYAE